MDALFSQKSHRRWNPLKQEWVLVSPHRTQRPWQGQVEGAAPQPQLRYDPECYLCPGNRRAGGKLTPSYSETFVFDNDFAALQLDLSAAETDLRSAGLLRAQTERGICRVLCFDPRHDLILATMTALAVRRVVETWVQQEAELGSRDEIGYVQIFENRGAMMGASNPHPHGQIWATEHLPNEIATEYESQKKYLGHTGQVLLDEYLKLEQAERERIVAGNDTWTAMVPFWAVWPFELILLPNGWTPTLGALTEAQREGLASILRVVTAGYNRVFNAPFPYSMGFHTAPLDGAEHPEWQLHAHFYPPLLRSATVRKFMVGFELLGSPQRDITPESAAEILRNAMGV